MHAATPFNQAVEVVWLTTFSQASALRADWNALAADIPFRRWEWLDSWWRCYGHVGADSHRRELLLLAVFADGELIGGAPWYLERSAAFGNVIRFVGDGEACSEYLGLLCRPGQEEAVVSALAEVLVDAQRPAGGLAPPSMCGWDLLELNSVCEHDAPVHRLLENVSAQGLLVHAGRGPTCWRIELPATWGEYLARLSRSHRKQLLRIERRYFDAGRARLVRAETEDDVHKGLQILAELHQRRWELLHEPGCFARPQFATFLFDVAQQQRRADQLQLHWLECDGEPIAAEYHIAGGGVIYAYQAGIDPRALQHEPGRMITLALLKQAIETGQAAFDLLRGNEAYKAHWRAEARHTNSYRVVPGRGSARLRHSLWLAGGTMKKWLKTGLGLAALPDSQRPVCWQETTALQSFALQNASLTNHSLRDALD